MTSAESVRVSLYTRKAYLRGSAILKVNSLEDENASLTDNAEVARNPGSIENGTSTTAAEDQLHARMHLQLIAVEIITALCQEDFKVRRKSERSMKLLNTDYGW